MITNFKILITHITFFCQIEEPFANLDLPDIFFLLIERGHIDVLPL